MMLTVNYLAHSNHESCLQIMLHSDVKLMLSEINFGDFGDLLLRYSSSTNWRGNGRFEVLIPSTAFILDNSGVYGVA